MMDASGWGLLVVAGALVAIVGIARASYVAGRAGSGGAMDKPRSGVCVVSDPVRDLGIEDVVAKLCHELRTPLGSVLGNIDLALTGTTIDAHARTRLVTAQRNAQRLKTMLEQSGVTAGAPAEDLAECDLCDIVDERLAAFEVGFSARSLALSVEASEIELLVNGAELQLGQAVDIVLSNALKYTDDHGWIDVGLHRDDTGFVVLTCINSGQTFEDAEVEQVFESGHRTTAAVDSGMPGQGLGLGIARKIVEGHGGTLQLTAWPDRGVTSVQMRLPALDVSDRVAALHGTDAADSVAAGGLGVS
ncbi:signal transduction histidine kinase [Nocardioides daedukensis]|uniref:Sensor-like histidine kinase SenX3 n=1 Tax=Nocardioides daedukensis TaxID=634462 RepID=A0A7Y9S2G2_9ACTN|nr:HAMP domain-containing sensor histidine kinase [Nocardioides daedukensis]NYG59779.1 signal transduction histidine kinase [Nocardioides daedukensis]